MASGTKFIKEISDQFLICKICHTTYRDPKTLTCLHTFCSDCVQQHIDSERERTSRFAMYSRYISCPLCRKKTEIPHGGVRRLPDNFLVSNLTDLVNRRRSMKVPSCEICQTMRSRTNQACSKCLECCKLMCKSCVDLHRKTKVTEQHSLFDLEDEKDVECKVHPDEVVRFFCEPCETCVCILCTFQEHRDHEVCSFSEGFAKNKSALGSLLDRCRDRATDVQSLLNTINKCEVLKKETEENIRDMAISYTAQVRAMEKKLMKKLESVFGGGEYMAFMQSKDWLRECLNSIQSSCNLTDIIMTDRNLEMLLLKKEIEEKLSMLMEPALPQVPSSLSKQIKFIPGTVKLGYLSVINGSSDGDSDSLPTDLKCADTQTEIIPLDDSSTTMGYNITVPISDRSKNLQTEAEEAKPTANKETGTIPVHTRDKGTHAWNVDVKSKGVLTDRTNCHTAKCQTDKPLTYEKECMTTFYGSDAAVNTPITETLNKLIQAFPDVVNRGVLVRGQSTEREATSETVTVDYVDNTKRRNDVDFTDSRNQTQSVGALKPPHSRWPITSRGVQTPVTQPIINPLHKPKKDSSCMTEGVQMSRETESASVSTASGEINTDICRECGQCRRPLKTVTDKVFTDSLTQTNASTVKDSNDSQLPKINKSFRAFGTDPIKWPNITKSTETVALNCVEKGINATVSVKSAFTSYEKLISSLCNKSTSTPIIAVCSLDTQTPTIDVKDKASWSHVRQCSRGTVTHNPATDIKTVSKCTNTVRAKTVNKGSNATVRSVNKSTEVLSSDLKEKPSKLGALFTDSSTSTDTLHTADEETGVDMVPTSAVQTVAVPKLLPVRCFVEDPPAPLVDNFTTMPPIRTRENETCTPTPPLSDRWTCTEVTQLTNASTATNKIFTNDKGVVTPRTVTTDQFTNTPVVELRETEAEAIVTTADNETLTDRTVFSDAQTASEVTFSDSTTWIDFSSQREIDTMTDPTNIKDQQLMVRPFMFSKRTNTSPGIDSLTRSMDDTYQTDFPPALTRSLPESLLKFCPDPPSVPYHEINIPVPMVERGTMYSPVPTCDQSTMAMSILPADESLTVSTQTYTPRDLDTTGEELPYVLENEVTYEEKATSTESLVYMGLLSQLDDIDELFFVPNVTLETVSSATSLSDVSMETDHIEMLDQEMCTEKISLYDCGTQTYLTILPDDQLPSDVSETVHSPVPDGLRLSRKVDASTNTHPVRTVCRETCTPPRHYMSKTTMTHYVVKTDKSTNTARRLSRLDLSPITTSEMGVSTDSLAQVDKDTMTSQSSLRDSCVSTDSVFLDEKMAECIVKLKNVSERLQSPTQKTPGDIESGTRPQLARRRLPGLEDMLIDSRDLARAEKSERIEQSSHGNLNEDDRKKQVQDLLLQTQLALQRPKIETVRKLQPITTLKAKSGERLASIEEEHYKSRSLPRQFSDREQLKGVRMGRHAMVPSRLPLLRYNSAPGRIATVPTQKMGTLPRSPIRKSPTPTKPPPAVKSQEPMPPHVLPMAPDRRSSSQLPSLPAISESRTSSSCSASSAASCSSVETSSSGTVSSDIMPRKLTKKPMATSFSSSSTSSVQSTADASAPKKSAMSFMQRLLPRKKKAVDLKSPERLSSPPHSSPKVQAKAKPEVPKSPVTPKKSRPFVYMRQRIFSIQHDGEEASPKKEKPKKEKSKSRTDISSPPGKKRGPKNARD